MTRINKYVKRPWTPERKAHERRTTDNSSFYNSQAWRTYRRAFLYEHGLCVVCEDAGIFEVATVVDHIIPINEGGHKWERSNLQPLCHSCHAKKSGREAHTGKRFKGDGGC